MRVLIDTNIWSLGLRRKAAPISPIAAELNRLLGQAELPELPEIVRLELLAGISPLTRQRVIRRQLDEFPTIRVSLADYDLAAEYYTTCVSKGVTPGIIDALISAIAVRRKMTVFTADRDFLHYAKHLPIKLHRPDLAFS